MTTQQKTSRFDFSTEPPDDLSVTVKKEEAIRIAKPVAYHYTQKMFPESAFELELVSTAILTCKFHYRFDQSTEEFIEDIRLKGERVWEVALQPTKPIPAHGSDTLQHDFKKIMIYLNPHNGDLVNWDWTF